MSKSAYLIKTSGGYIAEVYGSHAFITADGIDKAKEYESLPAAMEVCKEINAQAVVEVVAGNHHRWKSVTKRPRKKRGEQGEDA